MRVNMEAGYGITEIFITGYGTGIHGYSKGRIILFSQTGCGIVLKLKAGCWVENGKSLVTDVTQRTVTLTR